MQRRLRGWQVDSRLLQCRRKDSSESIEHRDQLTQQQWFHLWASWGCDASGDYHCAYFLGVLMMALAFDRFYSVSFDFFLVSQASSSASTAVIAKTSSLNTGPIESSLMVLWFTSASCSSPSCRSGRWQNAATAARGLRLLKFDVWAPSCCTAAPLIVCVCVLVPFLCLLFTLIYIPPCMSEPVFYSVEFGF